MPRAGRRAGRCRRPAPGLGGNLAAEHPDPVTVPLTPAALDAVAALRVGFDQAYKASRDARDQAGMSVWVRAYEKSRRLALINACSEDRERPVIDLPAVEWAGAFALHQTRRMLYMLRRHASDGEFDLKRKRLIVVLDRWRSRHGTRGCRSGRSASRSGSSNAPERVRSLWAPGRGGRVVLRPDAEHRIRVPVPGLAPPGVPPAEHEIGGRRPFADE